MIHVIALVVFFWLVVLAFVFRGPIKQAFKQTNKSIKNLEKDISENE